MKSESLSALFEDAASIAVERAVGEFRAGRPVLIEGLGGGLLAFPVEGISEELLEGFQKEGQPRLIIPSEMLRGAKKWNGRAVSVELTPLIAEAITVYLGRPAETAQSAIAAAEDAKFDKPSESDEAGLTLAKLALLLPAVLTVPREGDFHDLGIVPAKVGAREILGYRDRQAHNLRIVARAHVPLEGVQRCEFVVFRGGDGFRDQIAVIVGEPRRDEPVLVRIHSACLTGDLFGSLKCDCGDQLRGTVRTMSEQGGGIVLYLDQEGRGNGIANKIRAYDLQAQGYDTYDADGILGFGFDQRRFDFGARMLKLLGYNSIRLMTNNPEKIGALQNAGLEVVSTHRVMARHNMHNVKYLATKRDRAGHLLGEVSLDGMASERAIAIAKGFNRS